ncbi:rhomboid family protein [Planoprotostelium fungivorum]|uniref:rhomboid protease n=1 Tax=Planoprotostelium fungivorum TaxID=1890364 RepID=A0A2P6N0W3_9EUKA|nr:rhomboid family protein [Planoprotostelium fungivorum]
MYAIFLVYVTVIYFLLILGNVFVTCVTYHWNQRILLNKENYLLVPRVESPGLHGGVFCFFVWTFVTEKSANREEQVRLLFDDSLREDTNDYDDTDDEEKRVKQALQSIAQFEVEDGTIPPKEECLSFPPRNEFPFFIWTVSFFQVVVMASMIAVNRGFVSWNENHWLGPSVQVIRDMGSKDAQYIHSGQLWRLITPIFMHVGVLHLILNLYVQIYFGRRLESWYGMHRMIIMYMMSGIYGNMLSTLFLPQQIQVGASGAIFGLNGILLAEIVQRWRLFGSPGRLLFIVLSNIMISVILGFVLPGVDNFCHLGGLLMGATCGFYVIPKPRETKTRTTLRKLITSSLILFLIVGAVILEYATRVNEWCTFCHLIGCLRVLPWCQSGRW